MGIFSFLYTLWLRIGSFFKPGETLNGSSCAVTLGEVYQRYVDLHLPTVTEGTRIKLMARTSRFISPHLKIRIAELTPEKVAGFLKLAKSSYVQGPYSQRFNFFKEIKDLRAICQWWSDQYDYRFKNPVRPFHRGLAVIADIPEKDRKISMEETLRFLEALPKESMYRDLATVQFYCAGRIGEIAGIQIKNINLEKRVLVIREVITWVRGEPKIKALPKNGKAREVFINDTLLGIFVRRIKLAQVGCPFLFHDQGKGLKFNRINVAFNRAWKRAGLSDKFSGSHLLRFSSAQAARKVTGSLDAAASVTGHQSMTMAAHYGKLDSVALNQNAVLEIEKHMTRLQTQAGGAKS